MENLRVVYKIKDATKDIVKIGLNKDVQPNVSILPTKIGPVSTFNAYGKYSIRKDLPKKERFMYERVWRWKQWAGRNQTVDMEETRDVYRDCYPRDFVSPPAEELTYFGDKISSRICNKSERDNIKHIINLFLEIFGECEIVQDDLQDIIKAKRVNWEILPQGQDPWDRVQKYLKNCGIKNDDFGHPIMERQKYILASNPLSLGVGTAGFKGYVAYIFNDMTVLESVMYGNAIYIFDKNWEDFSKLTKAEILSQGFQKTRIIHSGEWKTKLKPFMK
ncbi:MAG TPA: hypothetical protein PK443_02405 [bacterium]|nr:hypothetical protein [bacterium]